MSRLASLVAPAAPLVGIEISSSYVAALRTAAGRDPVTVSAAAVEPLPAGAIVPALNEPNVRERDAVAGALRRVLDRVSARKRAVLVVPDSIARVSLLRFEKVPSRAADLIELIRWQVRKTVPFRVEEAQIAFAPAGRVGDGGREFAVVLARRDIVAEYESLCLDAGVQAGVVDLATLNLVNAVVAAGTAPDGDWLLVNAAGDYLSVAILRGSELLFFRHRGAEGDETLADVVHQTAMYYEDRLQGRGFARVLLGGAARSTDAVRQQLETRLGVRVQSVDPRPAVVMADRIGVGAGVLETLTPAMGLLLRERMA